MSGVCERSGTRRDVPVSWLTAWRRGKRVALVVAAVWCIVLGVSVTAVIVSRGSLGQTPTPVLAGVIAMLFMPGLTALAMGIDARERRRQRASGPAHRSLPHPGNTRAPRPVGGRHAFSRDMASGREPTNPHGTLDQTAA